MALSLHACDAVDLDDVERSRALRSCSGANEWRHFATYPGVIETDIPSRLDNLRFSAWHVRVVIALGITEGQCENFDPRAEPRAIRIQLGEHIGLRRAARVIFAQYRSRAVLGLSLMIAQAFFYNAIFFTYALTLTQFYGVKPEDVRHYLLPFAAGNLLGPILLGRMFDVVGRKPMITFTYAITGLLFERGLLNATTHTLMWSASFFFASEAASSAYLKVSELFPLELRALAIALFYAVGTGTGGLIAPALFGALIESESRFELFVGYVIAGVLMMAAAAVAFRLGVPAEWRALEDLAPPLSTAERSHGP